MCWAQTVIDKSAAVQRNGQANGAASSDSQGSAYSPDFFDDSLLLDGFQDTVLGAWDGEPDFLLDELLKQEAPDVFPTGMLGVNTSEPTYPIDMYNQKVKSDATPQQVLMPVSQRVPQVQMHPGLLQQPMQVPQMAQPMQQVNQQMPQVAQMASQMAPQLPPQMAPQMNQQLGMQGMLSTGQVPSNMAQMQLLAAMMASGGEPSQMMCGSNPMNMANQMMMLAQQAGMSRGFKNQVDMDEAIDRVKKKRRESAQRSRARKNCYMKQLEEENKALKDENARLRSTLCKFSKHDDVMASPQVTGVWNNSVGSSTHETAMPAMHMMGMAM